MKPVGFQFAQPDTLAEAMQMLRDVSEDTKIMSGGQSLGPMLNLRLARPEKIISIAGLSELREVDEGEGFIEFGTALRHAEFEDGSLPEPISGMMRHVAKGIAYRAVRNRGTIGGSLCHADPAADWITALTALGATVRMVSAQGDTRDVDMTRFIHGAYRTELNSDELLKSVILPRYSSSAVWGYYKTCRKVGEFADAIASWVADPKKRYSRVVFGATAGAPIVSIPLSRQIAVTGIVPSKEVIKAELERLAPDLDRVKKHLLAVALQRCTKQALNHD
ncbi:FAD binding domain-containing protein [Ruegeria sp. 2012CJ41-6]|uniref:FAD binding domain-containing protein n=1 Tax=Ruegeria spongiae TaxID=2942209 RepID=A0ABT0Q864_9RHOB|nr:FAD binding domain-containing protein [Ruegeria spongiae]MCL6286071.1 FAD binding domain-containing protein [Ruegeria spongiae]